MNFFKKEIIKIFKDFPHEKDRIQDREERSKDSMKVKESEKENSYFHKTVIVEEYVHWVTLHQFSMKKKHNILIP